jgi:hypothetical protein
MKRIGFGSQWGGPILGPYPRRTINPLQASKSRKLRTIGDCGNIVDPDRNRYVAPSQSAEGSSRVTPYRFRLCGLDSRQQPFLRH